MVIKILTFDWAIKTRVGDFRKFLDPGKTGNDNVVPGNSRDIFYVTISNKSDMFRIIFKAGK